jgi:DMSO/TMAO reductase YedYZ molybdopterin-dependent catalytic subunit
MAESSSGSRRRFLKAAGTGILAVGVSRVFRNDWAAMSAAMEKEVAGGFPNVPGMPLEVTPNDRFYEVSNNWYSNPNLDAEKWHLKVGGLVAQPLTLTYAELQALPAVEEYATLKCIGDPVDGDAMGNALWKGVRLRELLDRAGGARPGATELILRAADDYSESCPLEKAMADGTILAYRMNGVPLAQGHGFPARVIVPGIYGMKNVKWLTGLELADYDYKGYWEKRGWSDIARYHTISRVDVPKTKLSAGRPAFVGGVAFAGDRGIRKVEVSVDGGGIWREAQLRSALSPYSWVLWVWRWEDPRPGNYRVTARATDGTGVLQQEKSRPSYPDGAAGLDAVEVSVA